MIMSYPIAVRLHWLKRIKIKHMKKQLFFLLTLMVMAACNESGETSTKDEIAADSTGTIDTIINQDTLLDYDGKRL